ncbi:MAG: S1 RNA-binding domain-containing protein [Lachnospiraceae bacterium]|nr:S1 RNA-binding domain-containing protein [Lachnospiraceae bacterium]
MIRLGEKQTLTIVKKVEFGVYLADVPGGEKEYEEIEERILLPIKQVSDGAGIGDEVEVFVYRDSKDRLIATTNMPKITLHKVAMLKVAQVGKFGAFLDWGLEKDLLLPFKEQTGKIFEGDDCLVALYIDKSNRLCATMKVYKYLELNSPYKKEDKVEGFVYEISDQFGVFVAVDNCYSALIPKKEVYGNVKVGDKVTARVTAVKSDGKLNLSIREKAYLQMDVDAKRVMDLIDSFDGALPFTDKANPEVIRREIQMSKNEFKRAVGRLLKEGKIEITETSIRRK